MKFFVFIHKQYFPKNLWLKDQIREDFQQWTIIAKDRKDAAEKIWEKFGNDLLLKMNPNLSKFPRKVSLFVGSGKNPTTYSGRLSPVLVYTGNKE